MNEFKLCEDTRTDPQLQKAKAQHSVLIANLKDKNKGSQGPRDLRWSYGDYLQRLYRQAAWLEDGFCVCDQCPGEDEHVQNEAHDLLICQDHRVCELRKHFSFLFTYFFEDVSAAQPFLLQQVNNQLVHDFFSQQNNILFLFLSAYKLFVAGRDQSAADQPNNLAGGHPPL